MEQEDLEFLKGHRKVVSLTKDDAEYLKIEIANGDGENSEVADVLEDYLSENMSDDDLDSLGYQFPQGKKIILVEKVNSKLLNQVLKLLKEIGIG